MNKRIAELMIEAGKTIPGDKHIDADFCEKFAELIVRECVQTLLDNTPELFTNEAAEEDWDRGYRYGKIYM